MTNKRDNRTPIERLMRLGWDALDAARRNEPLSLDQITQNARNAVENVRRGILDEKSLKTFRFTAPTDNAISANVELELSVGESLIYPLDAAAGVLLDADLTYLGSLSFGVSGDVERMVFLRQSTPLTIGWANPVHWTTRPRWKIGLSRDVPLDLRVQGGVGDADVNLSRAKLQSLRVEGNIGGMNITLPSSGDSFATDIRGGAGAIALNVPKGAASTVNVQGGVGGFAVTIEPGAAVQIKVQGGVGKATLVPGFQRSEACAPGLPNTGVWQTPDFDMASRQVTIAVNDAVFGNISVRVIT